MPTVQRPTKAGALSNKSLSYSTRVHTDWGISSRRRWQRGGLGSSVWRALDRGRHRHLYGPSVDSVTYRHQEPTRKYPMNAKHSWAMLQFRNQPARRAKRTAPFIIVMCILLHFATWHTSFCHPIGIKATATRTPSPPYFPLPPQIEYTKKYKSRCWGNREKKKKNSE